ncbi:MAG: NADPH-dependent FMN reductase [Bacillota bacterium]
MTTTNQNNVETPRIGILVGSTRPGRKAGAVASWAYGRASHRSDATFDLIDLAAYELPLLDEPLPPALGHHEHEHTRRWAAAIDPCDGFVMVTPEYNHSTSAALKNGLDYLFGEWNNKSVGFISYGSNGGVRAVEQLRCMAGELMLADVRSAVALPFAAEFKEMRDFTPSDGAVNALDDMLDQVTLWARALKPCRTDSESGGPDSTVPVEDPQTALPQTTEWSNAPTDRIGLSDDQADLSGSADHDA